MKISEISKLHSFLYSGKKWLTEVIHKKRIGTSLSEMLLALAILGILAAILLPVIKSAQPDKLETLHKKANYIVEHVVADIAFDEDLYPPTQIRTGLGSIGAVTVNGITYAGEEKFCELFASRVNKASGSATNCKAGEKTFTSIEGIDWYLPISSFDGSRPYEEIKFDVNGTTGPNCNYNEETCPNPDIFIYYIKPTGKLYTNNPTGGSSTYCVNLVKVGPGDVMIKPKYGGSWTSLVGNSCGKAPGEYLLKATPASGYEATPWQERNLSIADRDVDVNIEFRLIPEVEKRQVVLKKIRNYGFLGSIFSEDKISDGQVFLGDQEISFGSGTSGCYTWFVPGCKIYETVVEVDAGQYSLWAKADEKSSVSSITPSVIDVTSKDGSGEVSFVWSYYDDQSYDVKAIITGDHYCMNADQGGSNNSTVSGTMTGQKTGTEYQLTVNAAGGCTWIWDLSDPSITYGSATDKSIGGKIRAQDVNIPIRLIAPEDAVDENPITHNVIVNQICPDGASMCANVQGAGEYPEGTSNIHIKVQPQEGYTADWTEQTISMGTEDVILTVTLTQNTYCINTSIVGSGTVQPSTTYCGLAKGTYTVTAVPATGWMVSTPGWVLKSENPKIYTKDVEITNSSVNQSVTFEKDEDYKYCANITVECRGSSLKECGTFTISGTGINTSALSQEDSLASFCGLSNGNYTINVEPDSGFNLKNKTLPIIIENANYDGTIVLKPVNKLKLSDIEVTSGNPLMNLTFVTSSPNTSVLNTALRITANYQYTDSGNNISTATKTHDTSVFLKSTSSDKIVSISPDYSLGSNVFNGYIGGNIEVLSCDPSEDDTYFYDCSGKYVIPQSLKKYKLTFGQVGTINGWDSSMAWWRTHCEIWNVNDNKKIGTCGYDTDLEESNETYILKLYNVNMSEIDLNGGVAQIWLKLNGISFVAINTIQNSYNVYIIPSDLEINYNASDGEYNVTIGR